MRFGSWFRFCSEMVQNWFRFALEVVQRWFRFGADSVQNRCTLVHLAQIWSVAQII